MSIVSKVIIRTLEYADLSSVISLLTEFSSQEIDDHNLDDLWLKFIAQPNVFGRVATFQNQIIGYGIILIETKVRGAKVGHIEDIVVNKQYRSEGVGSKLVKSLVDVGIHQGCYKLALECSSENMKFYENLGFENRGCAMRLMNISS